MHASALSRNILSIVTKDAMKSYEKQKWSLGSFERIWRERGQLELK